MKKRRGSLFLIGFATVILFSCKTLVPVYDVESKSITGGKNEVTTITVQSTPVRYENNTIKGVSSKANIGTTAVIFPDDRGRMITNYSDINTVSVGKIKMVEVKEQKNVSLNIQKYFYDYSQGKACANCITAPLGAYQNPEVFAKEVNIVLPRGHGLFEERFISGEPIDILLNVSNVGGKKLTKEFVVVDVVPDYLEFQSASYYTSTGVKKVIFDVHKNSNNQVVAFKIVPDDDGFGEYGNIQLKITTKPVLARLRSPKYSVPSN